MIHVVKLGSTAEYIGLTSLRHQVLRQLQPMSIQNDNSIDSNVNKCPTCGKMVLVDLTHVRMTCEKCETDFVIE